MTNNPRRLAQPPPPQPPQPPPRTAPRNLPRNPGPPPRGPITPHLYRPDAARPVRAKLQHLAADTRVVPHSHPWAQLAVSATGVARLTVAQGSYIVPPSRALWIPPGVEHAVTVVEDADLLTLYLHQPPGRCGPQVARALEPAWRECRVLEVSGLLRALALELDTAPDGAGPPPAAEALQREARLNALLLDELRRARTVPIGVGLPADKRLRTLCESVLDDPARHATLDGWARACGASPRTVARLFRSELGTSFAQWRQQALLSRAMVLAARKLPMAQIAAELGYASPSAFTAMVRRSVGAPPSRFFAR
jgi:AraC-like DNA-binding protein/quercetin dioxygenase-like cupin family protein